MKHKGTGEGCGSEANLHAIEWVQGVGWNCFIISPMFWLCQGEIFKLYSVKAMVSSYRNLPLLAAPPYPVSR